MCLNLQSWRKRWFILERNSAEILYYVPAENTLTNKTMRSIRDESGLPTTELVDFCAADGSNIPRALYRGVILLRVNTLLFTEPATKS